MVTDQIADLLTRIRNAQGVGHQSVSVPASKTKESIVKLLLEEGFISAYEKTEDEAGKPAIRVGLKYDRDGRGVIKEIKRVSTPGKRMYVGCTDIPKVKGGLGMMVVSTSKGMLSDRVARQEGVGGELVCTVF